jgi:ankyrin repeat protein
LLPKVACDVQDENKRTPLVAALLQKQEATARILIEAGVRLDLPNHKGNTPLHIAAANNMSAIVDLLLERGANADARNDAGKCPYQMTTDSEIVDKILMSMKANMPMEA